MLPEAVVGECPASKVFGGISMTDGSGTISDGSITNTKGMANVEIAGMGNLPVS